MSQPNCRNCKKLESQRKAGWRSYYQIQALLFQTLYDHTQQLRELERVSEEQKIELPQHFKDELIKNLKDLDCPICYETMTLETFGLTKCFHKICKPCLERLRNSDL